MTEHRTRALAVAKGVMYTTVEMQLEAAMRHSALGRALLRPNGLTIGNPGRSRLARPRLGCTILPDAAVGEHGSLGRS